MNAGGIAGLKYDGSVWTAGESNSEINRELASGVRQIFSNEFAFAALKDDGSVVTWGAPEWGGDSSAVSTHLQANVKQIFSSRKAFAAVKDDGSVITWGDPDGGGDSSAVGERLASGVQQIFSTASAFAALKHDGTVVTWGSPSLGGDSSSRSSRLRQGRPDSYGVKQICSTEYAFAALFDNGAVTSWGQLTDRGWSIELVNMLASGVKQLFSTTTAFAVLRHDGSVATWGGSAGGDSHSVAHLLTSGVQQIFSTATAFAALKTDGSVVTWGDRDGGGDSYWVGSQLGSGVAKIFSTGSAFAALKTDGSVITWGKPSSGGASNHIREQLSSNVKQIYAFSGTFAALKTDDSVVTWGYHGSQIIFNARKVLANNYGFFVLKADGSVVAITESPSAASDSIKAAIEGGVIAFADPSYDDWLTENHAPTEISISSDTLNENIPAGSSIATLDTKDPDSGDSFIYTLTSGAGDADNGAFFITGNQLRIKDSPDFEAKKSYAIHLTSLDEAGESIEKAFLLNVLNQNDPPSGLATIAGDPKAGSHLNIDPSPISDSDNLTGYKPAYHYLWESKTGSRPWQPMPSPDAQDGDNTYTLLSSDEGRQIRGKISYADSEGNQEVAYTEALSIPGPLDLDGDQQTSLADSLLLMRCWLGTYPRDRLTHGRPASTNADNVQRRFGEITHPSRITAAGTAVLDINRDGSLNPLTDGLLIAHYIHNQGWGSSLPTAALEYGVAFGDISAQLNELFTF